MNELFLLRLETTPHSSVMNKDCTRGGDQEQFKPDKGSVIAFKVVSQKANFEMLHFVVFVDLD